MARVEPAASTKDRIVIVLHDTDEFMPANAARGHWHVGGSPKNASWYGTVINNLHQPRAHQALEAATMGDIREAITKGLKRSAFDRLKQLTHATQEELGEVVRIPPRTLSRRKVFQPDESERILRLTAAFQRALEVFEDLEKARRWFSSPKRALDGKTPFQFCDTEVGAEEVMNLLGRIEHGVFS